MTCAILPIYTPQTMSSAMLSVNKTILGITPTKITSIRPVRTRLYATPEPNTTPPAQTRPQPIQITARPGTLVQHIESQDPRSGQLGVVIKRTTPDSNTLDVLWTSDGATTQIEPDMLILDRRATPNTTPTAPQSPSTSVFPRQRSYYDARPYRSHERLLPHKFPKDLQCPLDSTDPTEIKLFKFRMDNYLFEGHPNIRTVVTGDMEPPLLTYGPYLDYMREKCSPAAFVFNHSTADDDILGMLADGHEQLAKECGIILDNPPYFDGFRPCNRAIYFAVLKAILTTDHYILRDISYGDGIGLRNLLWQSMSGDDAKSKKLMAMSLSNDISDIKYTFVRHGVKKYFTEIHSTLAKLKTLGASKKDWEIFGAIFEHMSKQCQEYHQVVISLRDKLSEDDDALTLKSIEKAFTRKETVHKIGIDNKGTPVAQPVALKPTPIIPGASAGLRTPKNNATAFA